eukprot:1228258-Amorphochlora_amoeboformis.AAC.2
MQNPDAEAGEEWSSKNAFDLRRDPVNTDSVEESQSVLASNGSHHLDTIVVGPWMQQWEITNQNRHTEAFLQQTTKVSTTRWPKRNLDTAKVTKHHHTIANYTS